MGWRRKKKMEKGEEKMTIDGERNRFFLSKTTEKMGQKRKSLGSDRTTCSRNWQSHKGKELNSVPNDNFMEDRQCTMKNSGAKDLHITGTISIERSNPKNKCVTENLNAVYFADNEVSELSEQDVKNHQSLTDIKTCNRKNNGTVRNNEDSSLVSSITPGTQVSPCIASAGNSSSIETAEVGVPTIKNFEASANSNILLVANNEMDIMFQQENSALSLLDNSWSVDTLKNNMTLEVCDGHKGACRDLPNKVNLSSQISSNSIQMEATSSIHSEKSEETETINDYGYYVQQTCSSAACMLGLVTASVDANDSSRILISDGSNSRTTDLKCNINEAVSNKAVLQQTGSLLDSFGEAQHSNVLTVEGSLKLLLPAGLKEGASVPPSPIRGLVDELFSPNLPLKQHNQLNSCNEECANFSFRMENKVLRDDALMSNSKETPSLGSRDESVVYVSPALHENTALAYKCKHADDSIIQEKELTSSTSHVTSSDMTKDHIVTSSLAALPATVTLPGCLRKKLIVLDLNGLLADIKQDFHNPHLAHRRVGGKSVFRRPFCDDFLKFCFERFHVGVWSSRRRYNVDAVVDYLMGNLRHKLLFCWDQAKCTYTGYATLENIHKPLVLKELKKLWNKEEHGLPWEKGEFSPSNTLLIDDSPYKAICNPPHTAIFPYPYSCTEENDNSLGPGGDIRVYLEGLAMADDVQLYVQRNPFGQKAIADNDPSWSFYLQIIDKVQRYPN